MLDKGNGYELRDIPAKKKMRDCDHSVTCAMQLTWLARDFVIIT